MRLPKAPLKYEALVTGIVIIAILAVLVIGFYVLSDVMPSSGWVNGTIEALTNTKGTLQVSFTDGRLITVAYPDLLVKTLNEHLKVGDQLSLYIIDFNQHGSFNQYSLSDENAIQWAGVNGEALYVNL